MRIPKNILKKMPQVAAQESTRYAINGVRFARTGNDASAEALDGRILLRARWNDDTKRDESIQGKPFDVLLASSAIKATKLPARVKQVELCESDVNGSAKMIAMSAAHPKRSDENVADQDVDTVDGRFPKTNDVVPDYDVNGKSDCHVFAVDPRLFAKLLDAIAGVATDENSKGVRIVCPLDPTKPIRIDAYNQADGIEAVGVMMPVTMRANSGDYRAPETEKGCAA